jgi:hypothetical protein
MLHEVALTVLGAALLALALLISALLNEKIPKPNTRNGNNNLANFMSFS